MNKTNERNPAILIVEDDEELAQLNARLLKRQGYDALVVYTATEARSAYQKKPPDLFVLDIELPDGDGFSLCEEIRRDTTAPILFLTGKTESKCKVKGLEGGGDYYLTKPYDRNEFLAVIQSLLRKEEQTRKRIAEVSIIEKGPLTLKPQEIKAFIKGRDAELTPKEFAVLLMLVQNENKELTAEDIYKNVWGSDINVDTGTLRRHISQIKNKLDVDNINDFTILAKYGVGYVFIYAK